MSCNHTTEAQAWRKCQEDFRRNKAESKTWQEYNRMNRGSYAEYEAAIQHIYETKAPQGCNP